MLFWVFATVSTLGALLVIGQRNPIYSVLAIIVSFFGLSGLYILLEAPFVAVVQIIIYAGAIMVLFLFVVMLLNVPREDAAEWDRAHPYYRPWGYPYYGYGYYGPRVGVGIGPFGFGLW